MPYLNLIMLLLRDFFAKASKVCSFHLNMSDLVSPSEKCLKPYKNKYVNYNPHNNSHDFPSVANWLKLRFYICISLSSKLSERYNSTHYGCFQHQNKYITDLGEYLMQKTNLMVILITCKVNAIL